MLNPKYYKELLTKFGVNSKFDRLSILTSKILLENYEIANLHFNATNNLKFIQKVVNILFEELSQNIFTTYPVIENLSKNVCKNSIWIKKRTKIVTTKRKQRKQNIIPKVTVSKCTYRVLSVSEDYIVSLKNCRSNTIYTISAEKLTTNFTFNLPEEYENYFFNNNWDFCFECKANNHIIPTKFYKKIVFIASKHVWDDLPIKNLIPAIYLPNTKEGDQTQIKSIPALEDCISYFTAKYEVCYEQILRKGIDVETIVVCKDFDNIPQIIQDQGIYGFKLIVISNDLNQTKHNGLLFWNWKKEEIKLMKKI